MKTLAKKHEKEFIEKCDSEIVEDVVTSFDINPDELTWTRFFQIYQKYHTEKYGKKLTI